MCHSPKGPRYLTITKHGEEVRHDVVTCIIGMTYRHIIRVITLRVVVSVAAAVEIRIRDVIFRDFIITRLHAKRTVHSDNDVTNYDVTNANFKYCGRRL